jgi:hypothetical protein
MERDHFILCVRTYYPFARFFEFKPDELDVAQDLPKNYWAEPDKQWLGYFHFINGLRWDHGKVYVHWDRIKGKSLHQEKVLLEALKKLCTVGPFGDGRFVVHNVPPVAAIYPPKPPKPMPKRLLERVAGPKSLLERVAGWVKKLF